MDGSDGGAMSFEVLNQVQDDEVQLRTFQKKTPATFVAGVFLVSESLRQTLRLRVVPVARSSGRLQLSVQRALHP